MAKHYFPPTLRLGDSGPGENHGAALLLLIREKRARNWADLCRLFDFDPQANHSGHYGLRTTLKELIEAGLLVSTNGIVGPYQIPDTLETLLEALNLSLVEAANLPRYAGMAVRPVFGARPELTGTAHLFVLMPFAAEFDATYAVIQRVAAAMRIGVARADEIRSTHAVMNDIWTGICNSATIIADCTGQNPNVFYELGVAHTVGRDVVLLTQELGDIPFDIRHIRHIQYKAAPAGLKKLKADLRATLEAVQSTRWET